MEKSAAYYITLIAALAMLLGLCLFFSLCETSFTSLSRIKLKNMAEKSKRTGKPARSPLDKRAKISKKAAATLKMLDSYDKLLSSVLIGNTIVNVASSALATMLFIMLFGNRGVSLATLCLTIIILLVCEIAPKILAKKSPEQTAIGISPLLRIIIFILTPFNYLTQAWKNLIVRIFPVKAERYVTEDELLTFVGEVRQEGGINPQEEKMIRQAIEFDDITAAEIVTPRIDLAAIPEDGTADEIDAVFAETGFSRLPVYRDTIDNITGVMLLKDFHHEVIKKGMPPSQIVKPVVYVTKTMKISLLLRTLQEKHSHMAVLVDEFGGTLGIVTIEDIIEELVGEIWDEHDEVVEPFRINQNGDFTVLGSAKLHDMIHFVNDKTGDSIPPDDIESLPNTTVGNWVMENRGGLPRPGDQFTWRNLQITVSRVLRHRVIEVMVTII